jgi:hypothetical protein
MTGKKTLQDDLIFAQDDLPDLQDDEKINRTGKIFYSPTDLKDRVVRRIYRKQRKPNMVRFCKRID